MTRVYICDDSAELRLLLGSVLQAAGDIAVVGEAADGQLLAEAVRAATADVVVLDLSMPHSNGLQALVALRAGAPDLGIVVFSGFDRERMAAKALALGADSYLEKSRGTEELREAVRSAATSRRTARSRPA